MLSASRIGTPLFAGVVFVSGAGLAQGQATTGGTPNGSYTPLHAWYDVNQSTGIWENTAGIYNDEILVDVRDTAVGSGTFRGNTYDTNVETWAQFGGAWPRTGGFTGTQNAMTTWEVRNGAGIGTGASQTANGTWEDADGSVGIGSTGGYTVMMALNIHEATSYNSTWNADPGLSNIDAPILNGNKSVWDAGDSSASQPGKGLLWIDAARTGESGATWVMDAGTEMVSAAVDFDQWQVHTFVYDGASSSHYINGSMVASGDAGTDAMSSLSMWTTDGGWHRAGNLDFAEGIFYDEVLSGSDQSALESYLMTKWDISGTSFPVGDIDFDGDVDIDDLGILAGNWQQTISGVANGDLDEDGDVDIDDLGLLAGNWQFGVGVSAQEGFDEAAASVGIAVPEPGSLALLGLGGLALLRRRR